MKIIHCSDLHLDSPMGHNFDEKTAALRNLEICQTFSHMVQYAEDNQISAIMICGDLFDSNQVKPSTVRFVLETVSAYKSIHFFYLCGNHDQTNPLTNYSLPPNLHLFDPHWKYYRFNHVTIAGIELNSENCSSCYSDLHLDPNQINIVMLHGQSEASPTVDNIVLNQLTGKGIDYLALGHIHSYKQDLLDHRGVYCYSGCPEGRGFDECGPKGFVVLDVKDNKIITEFIDFAQRHIHKISVDISQCISFADILNAARNALSSIPESDLVRISLTGNNVFDFPIDTDFLETILSEQVFYIAIRDKSIIKKEANNSNRISLKNEFISSVTTDDSLTEQEKELILQIGLSAIEDQEVEL